MDDLKVSEEAVDQHRQWIFFSLRFFIAAALGCKTEKEVRIDIESAFEEARAARRFIIEQGGLHVDIEQIRFPRPSLSVAGGHTVGGGQDDAKEPSTPGGGAPS
jgi:hypothetical protein